MQGCRRTFRYFCRRKINVRLLLPVLLLFAKGRERIVDNPKDERESLAKEIPISVRLIKYRCMTEFQQEPDKTHLYCEKHQILYYEHRPCPTCMSKFQVMGADSLISNIQYMRGVAILYLYGKYRQAVDFIIKPKKTK